MLQPTNLDAITRNELNAFIDAIGNGVRPIKAARVLFPERPRGFVGATRLLSCYANNRAVAIGCRLRGEIQTALIYERICDDIYDRLPDFARWW